MAVKNLFAFFSDAKEYFLKLLSTGLSEPAVDLNNNEAEPQFPEKFDTKLFEK